MASFGGELVGLTVVFPVLAAALGATPAGLGLLMSLTPLATLAPILLAPRVEAARRKKKLVLLLGLGQRLPRLLAALALLLMARSAPFSCLVLIALFNLSTAFILGLLVPPWIDLLAETIPRPRMGRVMGYRFALSSALGFLSAGVSAGLLASFAFPTDYALLYLVSFGVMGVSWLIFALVDEIPEDAVPARREPARRYFGDLFRLLRRDVNLRRYLLLQGLVRLGGAVGPFYALAATTRYGLGEAFVVGTFIAARSAASVAGNLAFPALSDRIGLKGVLGLGVGLSAAAALLAALAPTGTWYVGVSFVLGLAGAAYTVAGAPFHGIDLPPRPARGLDEPGEVDTLTGGLPGAGGGGAGDAPRRASGALRTGGGCGARFPGAARVLSAGE